MTEGFVRTKSGKKILTTDGTTNSINPEKSRNSKFLRNDKNSTVRENYDSIEWNTKHRFEGV